MVRVKPILAKLSMRAMRRMLASLHYPKMFVKKQVFSYYTFGEKIEVVLVSASKANKFIQGQMTKMLSTL